MGKLAAIEQGIYDEPFETDTLRRLIRSMMNEV